MSILHEWVYDKREGGLNVYRCDRCNAHGFTKDMEKPITSGGTWVYFSSGFSIWTESCDESFVAGILES